ncbi:MAG: polyprenyl synthetase family protein [Alphaproteobacteria bacterium]
MTDFNARYEELKALVDTNLTRMFDQPALSGLGDEGPFPENRVWDAMGHAVNAGGKRLRPILVIAAAELFDIKNSRALKVANAVELLHTYSLVHDDLPAMDNSELRRGLPTVHTAYDDATAVLAGDALLTLAFGEIAAPTAHKNAEVRARLAYHLAMNAGINGMVGGQMLDILMEGQAIDVDTLKRLQNRKTGALIRFSAMAGAFMGEAEVAPLNALRRYGEKIGLAFQMVDDILDVEGDPSVTGKPRGGDAKAGKSTFVSHLGVQGTRDAANAQIASAKTELAFAGDKGWFLSGLADYVGSRAG